MEAGGFEPPSRDISGQASTCIVARLRFAPRSAGRQAERIAILLDFAAPPQTFGAAIPHFGARAKPAGRGRAGRAA